MGVRRSLVVLTIATVGLPIAMLSSRANDVVVQAQTEQTRLESLQLHTVGRGRVEVTVSALGAVEADAVIGLSFLSGGRVADLMVTEGDYVLAGDELVRLENEAERVSYDQALGNLELAQLRLDDLTVVDERDIRVAEAQINAAWGNYRSIDEAVTQEDIQAAELRVQQSREALELAEEARRIAGGLNERSFAELNAQIGQASFNLATAQLQLEQLQTRDPDDLYASYANVVQAQRELDRIAAGADAFSVERAEIAIQQSEYQLEQAETAYNRTILKAEIDGVVSAVNVEDGQLVTAGVPVVEQTDIDPLYIDADIDEIDIQAVTEGMQARVSLDALDDIELRAQLDMISLLGFDDGSGIVSYNVRVTLEDTDPRIRPGMTAEALVVADQRENVLIVPNLFIRLERTGNVGYINLLQPDGSLEEVQVRLGLRGLDNSEIVSGLREGDIIAVDLAGESFSLFGG
ncbi:MAG: efflux RND transporter periplasmic adaptor subunit [Burkholderiales bacterium]|nr:efflux RND transporter periplasmic adaptor subunit [Anaerolineae bacterium]